MRKIWITVLCLLTLVLTVGFNSQEFSIDNLDTYNKEYKTEEMEVCSSSSVKTYEPYLAITSQGSAAYQLIHEELTVDPTTGLLYDEDGFIAAALGYQFGPIGSRFYFTLDTGIVIPIIKADAKAAIHAEDGCSAGGDASVIEFIIDTAIASEYFGTGSSGLVGSGNFNNDSRFRGSIVRIERVLDEKVEEGVQYDTAPVDMETQKHSDKGYDNNLVAE